jgi:hypothetical protein
MRFHKPLIVSPKILLSMLLGWLGLLATAFAVGARLG